MISEEVRRRTSSAGTGPRAALLVVFICSLAPSAFAASADELIHQGVALRRTGDDSGALQLFQQAYQAEPSPRALVQMGLAEQAMGRWVTAYEHLKQALASPNDRWIKKSLPQINGALARVEEHVGHIDLRGGTAGAEVRIEGVRRGTLPLAAPVAVATGKVTIDVSLAGFNSLQRVTVVSARETVRESLDPLVASAVRERAPGATAGATSPPPLVQAPSTVTAAVASPAPAANGPRPSAGSAVAGTPVVVTKADETAADGDAGGPGSLRPAAKWAAWGAGVLAAGVGIFGAVRQTGAGEDFDRGCAVDGADHVVPLPGSTQTTAGCESLKSRVDSGFALEVGGFVAAGALAVTGLVLWLTEPATARAETARVACSPGVGHGPWLSCALRF